MPATTSPVILHQLQRSLDCSTCHFRTLTWQKMLHGFVLCKCTASWVSLKQVRGRLGQPGPCRTAATSKAGIQLWLLRHCSPRKHARDEHTAQLLSLQHHPIVRMHKKKKKETTSEHSLKDGERSTPCQFCSFSSSAICSIFLTLPNSRNIPTPLHEKGSSHLQLAPCGHKQVWHCLLQAAPTYCLKVSRPSLQIQRPQGQVRGFIRWSKCQKKRGFLALEQQFSSGVSTLGHSFKTEHLLHACCVVLLYSLQFFLASWCQRIYHILPSCDTYGFPPSLLCCPWLYVLPVNSMYQKLQVFYRKI